MQINFAKIKTMDKYMNEHICKPNGHCVYRQSKKIDKDTSMFVYLKESELKSKEGAKCFFCGKEIKL